jgi:hypothetical protein
MSTDSHLRVLQEKHSSLEARIRDEDSRPAPDSATLHILKVRKLRLKEDIEHLRAAA